MNVANNVAVMQRRLQHLASPEKDKATRWPYAQQVLNLAEARLFFAQVGRVVILRC